MPEGRNKAGPPEDTLVEGDSCRSEFGAESGLLVKTNGQFETSQFEGTGSSGAAKPERYSNPIQNHETCRLDRRRFLTSAEYCR